MGFKRFLFILFGIMVISILLSCSLKKRDSIVIWSSLRPAERIILERALQKFSQRYSEFEFVHRFYAPEELRTNFIVSAYAGKGPALIHCASDNVGPLVEMELIEPLEQYFNQAFLDSFITSPLPSNVWFRGHLYMIADRVGNHLCLVYNRQLISKPPTKMSELIQQGLILKKNYDRGQSKTRYILAWNYTEPFFAIPFITAFGGFIIDSTGNPTLNTPAVWKAARFIQDLAVKYQIIPRESDYESANAMFLDGTAAMIINGPWSWATYIRSNMDIGISRIPLMDSTGLYPRSLVSPLGYCLNRNLNPEEKEIALNLIRYLTSTKIELQFVKTSAIYPSRKDAFQSEAVKGNRLLQESLPQLLDGIPMPVFTEMRWIWDAMRPAYQGIFSGYLTPEEAAQKMQKLALKLIQENRE